MLQFAVGFVITPRRAAVEGDQIKQIHAGTKNRLQALIKAKQRKEASGKSVRTARPLQLFCHLYNARPPRPQPKINGLQALI